MCYQQDLLCTSTNGGYITTAQIHVTPENSLQPKTSTKFGETKLAWGRRGSKKTNKQTWNQVWTNKNISITTTTQCCFSDASLQRRNGLWEWPAVRTTKLHAVRRCWTLVWGPPSTWGFSQPPKNSKQQKWVILPWENFVWCTKLHDTETTQYKKKNSETIYQGSLEKNRGVSRDLPHFGHHPSSTARHSWSTEISVCALDCAVSDTHTDIYIYTSITKIYLYKYKTIIYESYSI